MDTTVTPPNPTAGSRPDAGRLAAARSAGRFTLAELQAFNQRCDATEAGRKEPDWSEQKRLILRQNGKTNGTIQTIAASRTTVSGVPSRT